MSVRSILLTPATPFILSDQSNELIQESRIIFRSIYLLNEQWAQNWLLKTREQNNSL
jgi:hypothetical protein